MTTYYVDDGGSQTAPYDTYPKAETTMAALIAAVGGFAADDEIHAGHDHAEDRVAEELHPLVADALRDLVG